MATPSSGYTYDPKLGVLIVGGNIIQGFAEDDMIEVSRDEDMWKKKVGTDGEVTRGKTNNKAGSIIIRLMQSSASNDVLSALALADEASNAGAVPVMFRDGSGRSLFATDFGWVKRFPKTAWKNDVSFWEWTIDTGVLNIFVGGN